MGYEAPTLKRIQGEVSDFLLFACKHPELTFRITRVGCGLAGYTNEQIASFFREGPENVKLDPVWRRILNSG